MTLMMQGDPEASNAVIPTGMAAGFFLAFRSSKRGRHEVEESLRFPFKSNDATWIEAAATLV